MDRIRLAREFDIPSWEEPAYLEICGRDEPLTMAEAEVLGLKAVLYVGMVRERELRRRLKEANVTVEVVKGEGEDRGGEAEGPTTTAAPEGGLTQTMLPPALLEEAEPVPEAALVPVMAPDPMPESVQTLEPVQELKGSKHYIFTFLIW